MEDAFDVIDTMIEAGVDLVILDSVAALVPKSELEGEIAKASIGLIARHMSQFLRRIGPKASVSKTTVIFINQIRDNIGVMYGDTTTTPGGRALKFYSSIRVQISKIGGTNVVVKKGGEDIIVGHSIKISVKKNKLAPPFRKAEFELKYDGRPQKPSEELAAVVLLKGLCPKYDAANNISPTGRTYKYKIMDEHGEIIEELIAKKKDEFASALEKCPKIQEKFLEILKNGIEDEPVFASDQMDGDLTIEEFEELLEQDISKSENEAEETEVDWKDI
jgi:recombination protein RecA